MMPAKKAKSLEGAQHRKTKASEQSRLVARTAILSGQQIAALTGLGLESIYKLMTIGTLPCLHVGNRRYVTKEAFEAWWKHVSTAVPPEPAAAPRNLAETLLPSRSRMGRVKNRTTTEAVLVSVPQFSIISGLGYSYTRKLIASGEIPTRDIHGRKWVIRSAAIAWLEGDEGVKS